MRTIFKRGQSLFMGSIMHLLFPTSCLLCQSTGEGLCASCDLKILRQRERLNLCERDLWAAAHYGDELAQVILLAKEKNNSIARNFLVNLLVETFMRATKDFTEPLTVTLIPIPSSKSANRKRGYRHSFLLAKGLAARVENSSSHRVAVVEVLRVNRRIADQSNLSKSERVKNLSGAYSAKTRLPPFSGTAVGSVVFLIDDLVTSGTSVREGVRALKEAGIIPNAVLSAGVGRRVFS